MRTFVRVSGMLLLASVSVIMLRTSRASAGTECSLGCIYTYGYDFSRDNVNPNESILKASTLPSLTATNSQDLNGVVYAEPLYVSQLMINNAPYNVVFVATEENYVYALNADRPGQRAAVVGRSEWHQRDSGSR